MSNDLRFRAIEARLAALEARGGQAPSGQGQSANDDSTFSFDKLSADWADKMVAKDPPRWQGETMVGVPYSECPAGWLDSMAGFLAWKAQKGREEVPVRVNNRGKPWHESDAFEAKLCRTWAKFKREQPAQEREKEPWE